MAFAIKLPFVRITLLVLFSTLSAQAQSPGVPVYPEGRGARPMAALARSAKALRESGDLLSMEKVVEQSKRPTCQLTLPMASTQKLTSRELWQRARQSHIRVGWLYLCKECDKWHLNLSGGYAITHDTVATCAHVTEPLEEMREGYLVAADEDENLLAITEILASNRALDTSIVRVKASNLTPVSFGQDVQPGDTVVCFSDPMGRRGFYSQGMVNRFVKRPFLRKREVEPADTGSTLTSSAGAASKKSRTPDSPTWMEVSTDWAPGSSGSAVLDVYGNAVAHVSEIEPILEDPSPNAKRAEAKARGTLMIFHDAITSGSVLNLIKPSAAPRP